MAIKQQTSSKDGHNKSEKSGGGFILPIVIIVGLIIGAGLMALSARTFAGLMGSIRQGQSREAREIAESGMAMVIGSGAVLVDGETIYTVKDAKVGIFAGIRYETYPHTAQNARGGLIRAESSSQVSQ